MTAIAGKTICERTIELGRETGDLPSVFIFSTSQSGEMYWSFVFVAIYVVVLIMQCPPLRCNLLQIKGFCRRNANGFQLRRKVKWGRKSSG